MFLKLLKNDFFQTGRNFIWLLAGGVVGGGIGALITMTQEIGAGQFIIGMLWNTVLILAAFLLEILGLVIILVSTNRALFTERGYLTFALPVSTTEMLLSKFITNVTFMLLNIAEVAGLVYVSFTNFRRLFQNAGDALLDQMQVGEDMRAQFSVSDIVSLPTFAEILKFVGFILIVFVVLMILAMMIALFVLTISHVRPFQAKPSLWILIFLVAVTAVCAQVDKLICQAAQLNLTLRFGGMLAGEGIPLNLTHGFVWLGLSLALFGVTDWLMSKKISLK